MKANMIPVISVRIQSIFIPICDWLNQSLILLEIAFVLSGRPRYLIEKFCTLQPRMDMKSSSASSPPKIYRCHWILSQVCVQSTWLTEDVQVFLHCSCLLGCWSMASVEGCTSSESDHWAVWFWNAALPLLHWVAGVPRQRPSVAPVLVPRGVGL